MTKVIDILMKSLSWCGHWFHEVIHDNGKKATGWVKKNKVLRDLWKYSLVFYCQNLICYWLSTLTKLEPWYIDISFCFTTTRGLESKTPIWISLKGAENRVSVPGQITEIRLHGFVNLACTKLFGTKMFYEWGRGQGVSRRQILQTSN